MAFDDAGFQCVGQVECDQTANAVRRRHWPNVPHTRDVIGMSRWPKRFGDWRSMYGKPDVIIGGFPCQGLSLAGKRAGLADARSGLWWQMLRVIRGLEPRYVVWENVPGLLSSNGGRDFERIVNSLVERGYRGCWRVLDARHFGVPQRRRRVFGVFARESGGDSGTQRCLEILALPVGVQGNPSQIRKDEADVAYTLKASVGRNRSGNRIGNASSTTFVSSPTVARESTGHGGGTGRLDGSSDTFVVTHTLTANGFDASEDGTGRGIPLVANTVQIGGSRQRADDNYIACTIPASNGGASSGMHPLAVIAGLELTNQGSGGNVGYSGAQSPNRTLGSGGPPGVVLDGCVGTLTGNGDAHSGFRDERGLVAGEGRKYVRRLTPREYERLQGWPDDFTRWAVDGRELSDGPRYKMIGNGIAKPVALWIAKRLKSVAETGTV